MLDLLLWLLHPLIPLFDFLYEDNRPEARKITNGCAIAVGLMTMASVAAVYFATKR